MKITRKQLHKIIIEELNEISPKQRAHDDRMAQQKDQRTVKQAEADELQQVLGYDWKVNLRMLEDRYQITVNRAYTGGDGALEEGYADPDDELDADQIASLEEPIDATADMSDDDVDRLAAALAAQAEMWDEDW
jgi:hypothetical protein